MYWADVILTVKGRGVLRGQAAKRWIEANLPGTIIDRGNGLVLLRVGGGTAFKEQDVRDALIGRSKGQVEDFSAPRVQAPVVATSKPVRPSLTNVIKTAPPRLAMHLDVDRDGRIDDDPANYETWVWGRRPEGRGAIVLTRVGEYADGDVVRERAAIELRWTGPYVDGWTASLSVDKPDKVRVYDGNEHGAPAVIDQHETSRSYQLGELPDFGGVIHSVGIYIPPELAIEGCKGMQEALASKSYPDEEAFKLACRKAYLAPAQDAYRQRQLAIFGAEVEQNMAVLETLVGKALTFKTVREVRSQLNKNVAQALTSSLLDGKTFAPIDALIQAMKDAFAAGIQLPSNDDFHTRLDELWPRIVEAAARPVFETRDTHELKPGVAVYDAIAGATDPRSATLWIEALAFPEDPDDSAWEVTLTFRFTPPTGRGDATEQQAVLRIAPWLMSNDLDPTVEIYAKDMQPERLRMAATLQDFAEGAGSGFVPVYAKSASEKGFCRDLIKSGYATAPYHQARVVMTRLDSATHLLIDALLTQGTNKDDVALLDRQVKLSDAQSQDNGGNYMVSPPSKQHPFGRIIYGHRDPKVCNHAAFLDAQRVQAPIRIDAVWLAVGHADEMISFLPDRGEQRNAAWPYKLLFANSRLALLMLLEVATEADPLNADVATVLGRAVEKHRANLEATIDESFLATHYPELQPVVPAAGFELPDSSGDDVVTTSARDYFEQHRAEFLQFSAEVQPRIDEVRATLIRELGIAEGDVLDVPVLFHGQVPITADSVNMLVLETGDATHCLVPKPFGPIVGREYLFERYLHERLTALGVTFTFQNDWVDFHIHEGEIHCGTNQLPGPLANYRWWEMAAPGVVHHEAQDVAPLIPAVPNPAVEVVGIRNEGNTCYLAATLQVLIHSTYVDTPDAIALASLRTMVTQYRADAANGTYTRTNDVIRYTNASAADLRNALVEAELVLGGREEDPCPVWEHLLEGLGEQFQLRVRKRYRLENQVPGVPTENDMALTTGGWQVNPELQDHRIVMIEPAGARTLDEAVAEAWNRTTGPMGTLLAGKVGGRIYRNLPQVEEETTWYAPVPRRFILQLKRFDYDLVKNTATKITNEVRVGSQLTIGGQPFGLRGVIDHLGDSPNTGHYVAYVKARGSETWFEANDSRVEQRGEQFVLDKAKSAYLFYFER